MLAGDLAQRGLHGSRAGPAVLLLEGDGAIDDLNEARIEAARHGRERARREVGGRDQHLGSALAGVDRLAGDELEQGRAHRPDVRLSVDLRAISDRLLRRHEAWGAEQEAGRRLLGAEARLHLREAEVEDLETALLRDEEVVGLDVAMNDALLVRGGEHVEQLLADLEHVRERKPSALAYAPRLEELSLEQLHHEVGVAVLGRVVVEDAHDTGVVDLVRGVTLLEKTAARVGVARELGMEHLDGGAAPVVHVRGGVNGPDAAARDARVDTPAVAQDATDPASAFERLTSHSR